MKHYYEFYDKNNIKRTTPSYNLSIKRKPYDDVKDTMSGLNAEMVTEQYRTENYVKLKKPKKKKGDGEEEESKCCFS